MAKAAGAKAVVNNIKVSEEARAKARERLGAAAPKRAEIKRSDARSDPRSQTAHR
jgi:hypothetical protein